MWEVALAAGLLPPLVTEVGRQHKPVFMLTQHPAD